MIVFWIVTSFGSFEENLLSKSQATYLAYEAQIARVCSCELRNH